jgi:hypothetical protein
VYKAVALTLHLSNISHEMFSGLASICQQMFCSQQQQPSILVPSKLGKLG